MKLKIPWFPLSVVFFFSVIIFLSEYGLIPSSEDLFKLLENVYIKVGLTGLFIAAFLEGVAYIGLYFPGATFIFISIIFTESSFLVLLPVVLIITLAFTISSLVNYYIGAHLSKKDFKKVKQGKKGKSLFFLAALNPNTLALYFLYQGFQKTGIKKVLYVPLFMFPYGFLIAYVLSSSSSYIKENVLSASLLFLAIFIIWFIVELVLKNKESFKRGIQIIYKYLFD